MSGQIAGSHSMDLGSAIGATIFPPTPIGGIELPLTTIRTGYIPGSPAGELSGTPVTILDEVASEEKWDKVWGSNPGGIPNPLFIDRPRVLPTGNPTVFFEGKRVVVQGDQMVPIPTTTPALRDIASLTPPSKYPTRFIGTRLED